jgi:hypothetical protein
LATAPRGEHDRVGKELRGLAGDRRADPDTAVVVDDKVEDSGLLVYLDLLTFAHPLDEGSSDLCACLVAVRVNDPTARVRAFLAKLKFAVRIEIEVCASRSELLDPRRSLFDEDLDRLGVTQCGASGERVLPV